jgi:hypothetical protein
MKQRKHRHTDPYEPQTITRAVTHVRLEAANAGKLAALDDLAPVYLPLCQQYVTLFCSDEHPNKLRAPLFATSLSERWHRVAIQQAAGIAQSWRTNRAQAYQDYLDDLLNYHEQEAEGTLDAEAQGEVAQVPGEERGQEASLHDKPKRTASRPPRAPGDQPRG